MFNRRMLENILKIYQLKAKSNPTTLRSLIPAKEMWRFFIDGRLQKKTRSIEDCINVYSGYGADKTLVENMTISEFIRNYDESFRQKRNAQQVTPEEIISSAFYTDMDDHAFGNLLDNIIKHNLQDSVTIADLLALDTAWLAFEVHESGYLYAVQNAAHYARTCRGKFTVQDILEIHKLCGNGVNGTSYASQTSESIGEFRKSVWAGYDVSNQTLSVAGIFQLLKNLKPHQHFLVSFNGSDPNISGIFHLNAVTLKGICDQVPGSLGFSQHTGISMRRCFSFENKDSIDEAFDHFRKEVQGILNGSIDENSLMKLASFLYGNMNELHRIEMMLGPVDDIDVMTGICYRSIILEENIAADEIDVSKFFDETRGIRSKIATVIDQFLFELYDNLDRQQDPGARLRSIIKFIQDCEQLHPFTDLNCRTFCMVMLQELLQRNGFPPTILDNPNCFDMLAIDEIFDLVVQGMQSVFKLIGSKKLYDVKTDDVLSQLQSRPLLSRFVNQLDEFVSAEEFFRKRRYQDESPLVGVTSVFL